MIKNRKFSKFLLSIFLPVIVFLSIGFFSFGAISIALAIPEPDVPATEGEIGGGAFYIGTNSTFTMTTGTISGFSTSSFGGGVYVTNGGTFNMSGGSIYGNTATKGGTQIYNEGTFTMTGGTIGKSGATASEKGIYNNSGKMYLYGGTIYESVLSSYADMSTKMACNIQGTITLQNDATIIVEDYAGTTPSYTIAISSTRATGTIVTLKGSSTEPDVSKFNVSGYDTSKYVIRTDKDSSGNWTVVLAKNSVEFPSAWKTQIASSTYMTTTVTPANITSIQFAFTIPTGYTKIGTFSTGLKVYQGTTATDIAFVDDTKIVAANASSLFSSLSKLTSITFDNFDTSNMTTMEKMFQSCSSLTSLDVSGFNTSNVTNMSSMFDNCSALTSLNVSGFNTSNVTNTSWMFYYCSALTSLDLSGFNTSKVTNMRSMFYNCKTLTSLDLSGFDTSKVTNMDSMFDNCKKLTSLDLSGFDTSKVTDMRYMFSGCSALTSLNVSGFNTSKVTSMYYMFAYCSALTSLDVSGFNTSNVTNMCAMFYDCKTLTSLDVSGFDTSKVTDMISMFNNCSALTSLDVSGFNTSKVTEMSYMFYSCSKLTSLDLSGFNMSKVTSLTNMLNFGTLNKIETLKTPYNNTVAIDITTGSTLYNEETGNVVTSVPANTSKSLTYTNVSPFKTFPTTWKTEIASSTYMTTTVTVSSIKRIEFPTTLNSAYTKIGTLSTGIDVYKNAYSSNYYAFYTGKKIYMPADSTQLFYGLNVERMSFESVDTTKTTNMSQMFANCTSMMILDLSTFNMANVSTVTNMLNFGTTGALGRIMTPYGNKIAVAITASSTLYDTSTGSSATGVLANSTASKTLAKKVTVSFNPYNGTAVSPSSYTAYFGAIYSGTIPSTSRSGYTFQGWYTEVSGGSSISAYTLLGDTTFYAHWASDSSGGGGGTGGGGTGTTLPSGFERQHETSQLGDGTIDENSVLEALDIFNSFDSNTFTADDVQIFAIVSPASDTQWGSSEYSIQQICGQTYGCEVAWMSNNGSMFSYLSSDFVMGLYNDSANIGFDQWYFFDSMFFVKVAEIFPNLEILDLRGLDTSLTTFSFRIPDSVQIVIVPEDGCNATLVSNNTIQFMHVDNQLNSLATRYSGYVNNGTGAITQSMTDIISNEITNEELALTSGLAFISPLCPEQFSDYGFTYEYRELENGVYLCLVETTDSFASRYGTSSGETYLAIVSYTSPIWITKRFTDSGGFEGFPDAGTYNIIDFRGLATWQNDYVPDIETYLDFDGNLGCNCMILPLDYESGVVQIVAGCTILNPDGTTYSFLPIGSGESTGGLEISKQRTMLSVSAENVDLYIDDKKWFDPRKNKIQIKTQNDGEE